MALGWLGWLVGFACWLALVVGFSIGWLVGKTNKTKPTKTNNQNEQNPNKTNKIQPPKTIKIQPTKSNNQI